MVQEWNNNIHKAPTIMAVWVWATLGLWVILPLKPRLWIIGVCCVSANPPVTLHAAGVRGIIIFWAMTDSSLFIVRSEFVKYHYWTTIDLKELLLWAVESAIQRLKAPLKSVLYGHVLLGNSSFHLILYVSRHVLWLILLFSLETYSCIPRDI